MHHVMFGGVEKQNNNNNNYVTVYVEIEYSAMLSEDYVKKRGGVMFSFMYVWYLFIVQFE